MNVLIPTSYPDGSPTNNEEKIWACLLASNILTHEQFKIFFAGNMDIFIKISEYPKCHIILENTDLKSGNHIQLMCNDVINSGIRQIAPDIFCKSTQKIQIKYKPELSAIPMVFVDDKDLCTKELEQLSVCEGFDDISQFYERFNEDFTGEIVHWTNLRYAE